MEATIKPKNQGSKRLFDNKILELLTRTHISITIVMYTVFPILLLTYGFMNGHLTVTSSILLFLAGLLTFSFVEYLIHRYLFHIPPTTPRKAAFARVVHGAHHEFPKDKERISMPPLPSILLASFFFFLFWLILGNNVFGFLPGFFVGYNLYSGIHYAVHAYQPPKNFLKILWVHHGIHHYKDHDRAFGVSSTFWDMIFQTMPQKKGK